VPAAREWWRWCSSTPQNHRPGQLAAHIALSITWGGLVGGRGATGGRRGGGEPADPIFFGESPLIHTQGLPGALKPACGSPGIGNILGPSCCVVLLCTAATAAPY
jgi:hypothetical protein